MNIPLQDIYDVFYSCITKDLTKHPELDINVDNNIVEVYLQSAIDDYEENLKTTLTIDTVEKIINEEIPKHHRKILGRLIYKNYIERELNHSLEIANQFNKRSELNVLGLQSKIVALRDYLDRVTKELNRSFTRNVLKGLN